MGTRLVPSIENIEGCFKYGGKWDKKHKLCRENGCTAPIKGIRFCWTAVEREDPFSMEEGRYVYEPIVEASTFNNECDPNIFDSSEASDEWFGDWPADENDACMDAQNLALQMAKDCMRGREKFWGFKCFTPRGRKIGCDQHNAVLADNAKQVIDAYKGIFRERQMGIEFHPLKKSKKGYRKIPPKRMKHYSQLKFGR